MIETEYMKHFSGGRVSVQTLFDHRLHFVNPMPIIWRIPAVAVLMPSLAACAAGLSDSQPLTSSYLQLFEAKALKIVIYDNPTSANMASSSAPLL